MSDEQQPPVNKQITVDKETAAILQGIEGAGDNVIELAKLAKLAKLDPDLLTAYAKTTGQQNDPEIKAFIQAVKDQMGGPTP